jgi:hypothetical protein
MLAQPISPVYGLLKCPKYLWWWWLNVNLVFSFGQNKTQGFGFGDRKKDGHTNMDVYRVVLQQICKVHGPSYFENVQVVLLSKICLVVLVLKIF